MTQSYISAIRARLAWCAFAVALCATAISGQMSVAEAAASRFNVTVGGPCDPANTGHCTATVATVGVGEAYTLSRASCYAISAAGKSIRRIILTNKPDGGAVRDYFIPVFTRATEAGDAYSSEGETMLLGKPGDELTVIADAADHIQYFICTVSGTLDAG